MQRSRYLNRISLGLSAFGLVLLALGSVTCEARAADKPALRICTGSETGVYFYGGNALAKRVANTINVEVFTSAGSIENMEAILDGRCDTAFVQNDALLVYSTKNPRILPAVERAGVTHTEAVHLACNRDTEIDSITDLTPETTVAVGEAGGSFITWEGIKLANKRYADVPTDPRDGLRGLNAVADGSEAQCTLYTAGIGNGLFRNDAQGLADRVVLVPVDDKSLDDAKDKRGKPIYSRIDIPDDGTYGDLMPDSWGGNSVRTLGVDAVVIVSTKWIAENGRAYDALLRGVNGVKGDIADRK